MGGIVSGKVDLAGLAVIATGTYAGASTQNMAVAHGLGVIPKLVVISDDLGGLYTIANGLAFIWVHANGVGAAFAVTAPTSTNFYVGTAAVQYYGNINTRSFTWVAYGVHA